MQDAWGAIMFHKMFRGDHKSTFMNSLAILLQICRSYCECFEEKKSSNFGLNLIQFL